MLYASFGDGHVQVARALAEALQRELGAEVAAVDTFRQTNEWLARMNERLFEWTTRYAPALYGWSYDWTRNLSIRHPLWAALARFSRRAAWQAVEHTEPDVIVQLFPDHALAELPPGRRPLVAVVLTDFAVHSRWIHANADLVVVPTDEAAHHVRRLRGDVAVEVGGIPVRDQFRRCRLPRTAGRRRIVLLAGGRGVFPQYEGVLERLVRHFPGHEIQVMCGRNARMHERVRAFAERMGHSNICPVGFTEDVASYLQQADFVIAKAGGVTIAECLASGTPMIFYKPLPGQERENARCLERLGAGRIAGSLADLDRLFAEGAGDIAGAMRRRALELGKPGAASYVAACLARHWARRRGCSPAGASDAARLVLQERG
ncbi:MGDG synthase family glycosyltransferase [Alicyclobacillus vulcanalis]|uniref:MGDG synthase family glycosyltransferase n=1 Tax=Alicyclobacillus vulcanalis TaxID=252246 RepID=UPI001F3C3507|nr:glycosyltransferase [Alicyclobacillus vulcanalis]